MLKNVLKSFEFFLNHLLWENLYSQWFLLLPWKKKKDERNKKKFSTFHCFQTLLETKIIFSYKLFYKSGVKNKIDREFSAS